MTTTPADHGEADSALPRICSGIPGLDDLLSGGFPQNSINVIMGEPGSGKTVLAQKLMFANARANDRPIVFFATLSEPLAKVIRYLQRFDFYDANMLLGPIVYDSIGDQVAADGVDAVMPKMQETIQSLRPKMLIIDSFKAIHDLATSIPQMRRMLYDLAGLLTAYDVTAFLLGEYTADQLAVFPEFAVADGILELSHRTLDARDERYVRVLKLRGSAYREGQHLCRISSAGLDVHPRLVSPGKAQAYAAVKDRTVATGVPGLDRIFGGGIAYGRSTFVLGPTGSGKSTIGLQFLLEGLRRGEHVVHVSLEENPTQVEASLANLGADASKVDKTAFTRLYFSPVDLHIDSIIGQIFAALEKGRGQRLVVDAVGDLLVAAGDDQRLFGYLYAVCQHLAVTGVTGLFLYEAAGVSSDSRLSALLDNIILLDTRLVEGRGHRSLRVVKARGCQHDHDEHTLTLTKSGATVA